MERKMHMVSNGDGWEMALKQTYDADRLDRGRRPIAIVPGYGMNAFIFGYHPTGESMEAYWAKKGFEVWSLNLRAQGESRCVGGTASYGFYEAGVTDLSRAFEYIVKHTLTSTNRVDGVGCSLGGTYLYVYLAFAKKENLLGSVVSMGGPMRWEDPHPILKSIASYPNLLGLLRFRGTRRLVQVAIPILKRVPQILSLYMHPEIIDMSRIGEMVNTIEDPNPVLNKDLAEWVLAKDLLVKGVNVTESLSDVDNPLLIVLANADGIVPDGTAMSAYHTMASTVKDVLRVGSDSVQVAHADLFISEISHEWVFEPIAKWLIAQNIPASVAQPKKRKPAARKKTPAKKARVAAGTDPGSLAN